MVKKLMQKWGIESYWDFFLINLAFALAGMSIVLIRKPLFHIVGIDTLPFWSQTFLYILFIIPLYQLNLLIWGSLLGKFAFFWEKEKHILRWLTRRKA